MKSSKFPVLNLRIVILAAAAAVLMHGCTNDVKRVSNPPAVSESGAGAEIAALNQQYHECYKAKKYGECEVIARKALAKAEEAYGLNDVRVEPEIANVIGVACLNGTCKDESELLGRLLALRTRKYGEFAQETIAARQMVAEGMLHRRKYAEAAELYKINLDYHKSKSPDLVAPVAITYARALYKAGKTEAALAALDELKKVAGHDEVKLLGLKAQIYDETGRKKEAGKLYEEMAGAAQKTFGAKEPITADYLVRYSEYLKKNGRAKEAAALDAKIASIYKDGASSK